jgi:hypothetical protein
LANISNTKQHREKQEEKLALERMYEIAKGDKHLDNPKVYRRLAAILSESASSPTLSSIVNDIDHFHDSMARYLGKEKDEIADSWEYHNLRRYPSSLYAMFLVLAAPGGAGLVSPIAFLSGFHSCLFGSFIAGLSFLYICIGWFLYDHSQKYRVVVAYSCDILPHYARHDGVVSWIRG